MVFGLPKKPTALSVLDKNSTLRIDKVGLRLGGLVSDRSIALANVKKDPGNG
ncbi:hypothetical protein H6G93_28560 [Nostoc sp. FACHB-973]|nr:hypothetical protein [Nostoc sp. FACHB-973]